MYNEEDEILPRTSRTRFAKVTMYLEVPSGYTEDTLSDAIEKHVSTMEGVTTTSWSDVIMSKPGSDDPADFKEPVGFIAPDGRFFLMESAENGLAHLELAETVYNVYKNDIDMRLLNSSSGMTLDYGLERAGFVKVHMYDIRYLAHFCAVWGFGEDVYTPDLTEEQRDAIVRYGKLCNLGGDVFVNGKRTALSTIRNADKLALRKIFEF